MTNDEIQEKINSLTGKKKKLDGSRTLSAFLFCIKNLLTSLPQVTNAWSQEHQSVSSFWGDLNTCPTPMTLQ